MNKKNNMRWASALMGVLLLSCAAWVIVDAGVSAISAFIAGIVLAIFGAESLYSAIKGRDSLLSRLGPLP